MKKAGFICLALLTVLPLVLVASPITAQTDWVTFRNPQFKFRFIYPPDWQVGTPRGPNVRGKVFSPKNRPFANCAVVVTSVPESSRYSQKDLNKDIDREVWTKVDWIGALSEKFPNTAVTETKKIRIDNRPAQFAVSTMTYEVMESRLYMKSMNFITMSPGYIWQFGCGAGGKTEAEAATAYEYWKPEFLRIFSSFVFEK